MFICVDVILYPTSKKLGLQVHCIERVDSLVIVGLDLSYREYLISHCSVNLAARMYRRCALQVSKTVRVASPSGISSRPLSAEAMIAVWCRK